MKKLLLKYSYYYKTGCVWNDTDVFVGGQNYLVIYQIIL